MRLKDKVSLITGASRGIGRAIALTFAREGSDVIVNYQKSRDRAEEVADEIIRMGRRAIAVQADVSREDRVEQMVRRSLEEFGRIEILVNNAGIVWRSSFLEATEEEWSRVLGVNLLGTYYCVREVAPHMMKRRYGEIINISSIAGIGTSTAGQTWYAPAKSAVIMLTKKLALELGAYNINVNAIAPGLVRTDMLTVGRSGEELSKFVEEKVKVTALRRLGEPQDIANVALFLASEESSFVTGQVIVADGGRFDYLTHSL